jgi:REP element-mobilizing transposase RayT
MARPLRFQYPGAIYHVMARGDGGKVVFETDDDRLVSLSRLGEICGSCGWRVHAWVLMGNHFHLLVETPQPNLVAGMKWLLGTFSQGWNRARRRRGHVFQGRNKSVPVNGSDTDQHYFRIVAAKGLTALRKGDEGKALMAAFIRRHTIVGTEWIANRLKMGHPGSVSRQLGIVNRDKKLQRKLNEIDKT